MSDDIFSEEDEAGFFQKWRWPLVAGAVLVLGAGTWWMVGKDDKPAPKTASVSMVNLMPPPPPPTPIPTPPPTPPPDEPIERPESPEQPEFVEETMPDAPPEPAADDTAMGSNIQGDGPPDGFGLVGKGGGGMIGGQGPGGGGQGTKFGWYAGQVQSRVAQALRAHRKTRSAVMDLKVKVWADASGRISRATLAGSTGDGELDRAIAQEILTGLQLSEPPPNDMPMPIVMKISARRSR